MAKLLHGFKSFVSLQSLLRPAALGCGFLLASGTSFAQFNTGQLGFGQQQGGLGQLGLGQGQTGQIGGGFGQLGQLGQGGLGQTGGGQQLGGLNQQAASQAGVGFGGISSGQNGQANPFGTGGMMGATTNVGGLAGAALMNRGLQNSMGGLGMGGFGGRGGMMGRGGMNQFNQNQNNSNQKKIRATAKIGFEVTAPSNAVTSRLVNDRLKRIPSPALDGITVEMSGRTAIIRGTVDSVADAKMVERLLSLEPGIDGVKNELTLAAGSPAGAGNRSNPNSAAPRPQTNPLPSTSPLSNSVGAASELVPEPD